MWKPAINRGFGEDGHFYSNNQDDQDSCSPLVYTAYCSLLPYRHGTCITLTNLGHDSYMSGVKLKDTVILVPLSTVMTHDSIMCVSSVYHSYRFLLSDYFLNLLKLHFVWDSLLTPQLQITLYRYK